MATPSTPKKRKITWAGLLADIPQGNRDGLNLEELLEGKFEASVFVLNSVKSQRLLLENWLGDSSDLVEAILEVTSSSSPASNLHQQIMDYLIAPSKVTSESKILKVAQFILSQRIVDLNSFREVLFAKPVEPDCSYQFTCNYNISSVIEQYKVHWDLCYNITVEEDCGYLPLGDIVTFFTWALQSEFKQTYKYHPQRQVAKNSNPGRNPSTDNAIIHLVLRRDQKTFISEVLYEYKLNIHPLVSKTEPSFLIELCLQAHYIMRYEGRSEIIACLTDLYTWHYFKLELNSSQKLEVMWYSKFMHGDASQEQQQLTEETLRKHTAFMCNLMKPNTVCDMPLIS